MTNLELFLVELDAQGFSSDERAAWLDAEEQAQLASFERARPRSRYLAAHAALRSILGRVLGLHPSRVQLAKNAWGRPETSGGVSFNMSHSGAHALVGVTDVGPIGVDIEAGDRKVSTEVFDAVASDAELEISRGRLLESSDRLRLWVRKEAVLKAFGRGLSFSPSALTVGAHGLDIASWRKAALEDRSGVHGFSFIDLSLPFRLFGAMAVGERTDRPRHIELKPLTI